MMSRGGENIEQKPEVESNLTPKSPLKSVNFKFEAETRDIRVLEGYKNFLITANWKVLKFQVTFLIMDPEYVKIRIHCYWQIVQ